MNQHLTFLVDKRQTIDALEATLAIARRGGLQLCALQLRSREQHDAIYLELQASEPNLLDLFLARLRNVIGIGAIDVAAVVI
jgi:acetolactate synthase regulatory subunit